MRATATSAPNAAEPARLGILGGSFDPPHLGHLELARHALRELRLDRVVLMPAQRSPHKPPVGEERRGAHATAHERLSMCRLLVAADPGVYVGEDELRRKGPSYTVDTLRALHDVQSHTSFTFILGADVARTLPAWREPLELLALAELAVAVRPGTAVREVRGALAPLLEKGAPTRARGRGRMGGSSALAEDRPEDRVRFLSMPAIAVSSSLVRDRVRRRETVEELVGPAVAAYIDAHGLYRTPVAGVSAP
ncbi:MAG TPA: nicotinate (nicotinamide) nucleotide adenylyltransferase [Solirubrobacteraceae bacterium]